MNIGYAYNGPTKPLYDAGCERVFYDDKETRRAERQAMIDAGGVREGDTLFLYAEADLGHGAEVALFRKRLDALGVQIKLIDGPKKPAPTPKVHLRATDEQRDRICALWYSSAERQHVEARAADILGRKVSRDQLNRLCGPRDGSRRPD